MNRVRLAAMGSSLIALCVCSWTALAQDTADSCVSAQQVQSMIDAMREKILEEVREGNLVSSKDTQEHPIDGALHADDTNYPLAEDNIESSNDMASKGELITSSSAAKSAVMLTSVGSPEGTAGGAVSNFQLIATTDSTRASLRYDFSDSEPKTRTYTARSFVVSAPVDKKSESGTNLATLDGLANGFEISFNVDHISAGLGTPARRGRALVADCSMLGISIPVENEKNSCDSDVVLNAAVAQNRVDIVDRWKPQGYSILTGFQLKVGRDEFSYYTDDELSKQRTSKVPWSVGGRLGVLGGGWYLGGDLALQHAFNPASSKTACIVHELDTAIECVTGALAPPKDEKRYLVGVEGRRSFKYAAVGVRVQRDVKNDEWRAELPIFLFRDGDKAFNGGVRFAWTTTDKFVAGLFVGIPFKYASVK